MIAADTSSFRRFLAGETGRDVELIIETLDRHALTLPPVVITEISSEPKLQPATAHAISELPLLSILDGYWTRAGLLRGKVIAAGLKAKIADALIAQSCIDHRVALITHDRDFRHYARFGLVLA